MVRKIKSRKNKRLSSSRKNKKSNKVFRAGSYSISSSKRKSRKVKKSRKKKTILRGGVRKSKLQSSSNFGPKRSKLNKSNINYNLQGGTGNEPIAISDSILNRNGGIKYVLQNGAYVPIRDKETKDRVVQIIETDKNNYVLVLFDSGKVEKIRYSDIPKPGGGNTVTASKERIEKVKEFFKFINQKVLEDKPKSDQLDPYLAEARTFGAELASVESKILELGDDESDQLKRLKMERDMLNERLARSAPKGIAGKAEMAKIKQQEQDALAKESFNTIIQRLNDPTRYLHKIEDMINTLFPYNGTGEAPLFINYFPDSKKNTEVKIYGKTIYNSASGDELHFFYQQPNRFNNLELILKFRGWRSCVVYTNEVISGVWRTNDAMSSLCSS